VSRVPSDKDATDAQPRDLTMVDSKITAPPDGAHLDTARSALRQHVPYNVQGGSFVFCFLDRCYNSSASGTHGKNCQGAELARAELHLVGGEGFVGLGVSQHELRVVHLSLKRQVQEMPNRAMRAVAADDEAGREF
jgi:hypothetical protein